MRAMYSVFTAGGVNIAERFKDGFGFARVHGKNRQPVGDDPAGSKPVGHELKIFLTIEAGDAAEFGRRRLAGDQVEFFAACQQEESSVLNMDRSALIEEGIVRFKRENNAA